MAIFPFSRVSLASRSGYSFEVGPDPGQTAARDGFHSGAKLEAGFCPIGSELGQSTLDMKYIALDIETTGQHYLGQDRLIAIGAAVGERTANGLFKVVEARRWVVDLRRAPSQTWKELWEERGYEQRCYDEFWSKNSATLDWLQAQPGLYATQGQAITAFSEFLGEMQSGGPYSLLFDTLLFDSVWLDYLLRLCSYAGLSRMRDGTGWVAAYEVDSLRFGGTGVRLGDWSALQTACNALSGPGVALFSGDGPHDPEFDAQAIFKQFAQVAK